MTDELFNNRVLTASINEMKRPEMRIYNKLYAPKAHMTESDKIAFEIISGSQGILNSVSIYAPATVTEKTGRKVVTMTAPRLPTKRFIHVAEMNALRAYGEDAQMEMIKNRIAREQYDMRGETDRTLEYWAATTLQGKIVNKNGTVIVDYGLAGDHKPTANPLWSNANGKPLKDIRAWQRLVQKDAGVAISSWYAYVGYNAMDALLDNSQVLSLLKEKMGVQIADKGKIERLVKVDMDEYIATYVNAAGTTKYFIDPDHFILIGLGPDVFDCPYAPVVDEAAPGGVGNAGKGQVFFSKSWKVEDPSGRWIKAEARPLPVLQVPGAIVYAKVV